jgi:phosphatidylinositol alpha-1,6-mannosyltransferase
LHALAETLGEDVHVLMDDTEKEKREFRPGPGRPVPGTEFPAGEKSFSLRQIPLLNPWLWPRWVNAVLWLILYKGRYHDVIVSHVLPLGTTAWVAGWVTHKPYVVCIHGMDIGLAKRSPVKRWLAGRVLRHAKLVVANSRALEHEVQTDFGVERSIVVYPCVKIEKVNLIRSDQIRTSNNQDTVTLLTVARLVKRKGHVRVLEAIKKLHDRGVTNVRYHIVGDGPGRAAIESAIDRLRLRGAVTIESHVSDEQLPQCYVDADVFVMPTIVDDVDREGFGTVYLEAARYSVPSVATDQPGVDEAVLDGKTGILVPDGNIDALAGALFQLITDRTLRETLGQAARDRVIGEFTCERQFGRLKTILASL